MSRPRFAVHVMAHDHPRLFGDLAASLRHPDIDVFAHIDAKSELAPFAAAAGSPVTFVRRRVPVYWGGFSQLRATFTLLRTAGAGYHRHSLLSGTDVLVRPIDEVVERWSERSEYLGIERRIDDPGSGHWNKVARYHFPDQPALGRFSGRVPRPVPTTFPLHQGSQWWSLTGGAVAHLVDTLDARRSWLRFHRYSLAPDEYVVQSVIAASPHAHAITDTGDGTGTVHGQHYIRWTQEADHPATFTEADLPVARASGACFARKVGPDWTWRGVHA